MATRSRTSILGSGSPMIAYAEGVSGGGGVKSFYPFVSDGTESEINLRDAKSVYFVAGSAEIRIDGMRWLREKTADTEALGNWEFEEIADGDGKYYAVRLKSGVVFNPGENVDVYYCPASS